MSAYYNEIDPAAAEWIRQLIKRGLVAPGEVDERSILEVRPDDLRGFTQCHFFAGIGVWSHALRSAGWADDRPVWTGSCPCQPFSAAGKGDEFADERHLWPVWFRLIRECRPESVFGEQVASKDALAWLDHVSTDLEGEGYTFGAVDTCAAGFGAPHIRQRLYFVAHAGHARGQYAAEWQGRTDDDGRGATSELADTGLPASARLGKHGRSGLREQEATGPCESSVVGHTDGSGLQGRTTANVSGAGGGHEGRTAECAGSAPGPTNGRWADAEWLPCRDGKARPVEPGTFPLVDGPAPAVVRGGDRGAPDPQNTPEARVMRLKGYGNAICAPQAAEFVSAFMECQA